MKEILDYLWNMPPSQLLLFVAIFIGAFVLTNIAIGVVFWRWFKRIRDSHVEDFERSRRPKI